MLSRPARTALAAATLLLGLLPGVFFFAWVHPVVRSWVGARGLPPMPGEGILPIVLGNGLLILAFGAVHSLSAQLPFRRATARIAGPRAVRAVYMVVTGLCLVVTMVTWRPLDLTIWQLVPSTPGFWIGDLVFYLGLLHVGGTALQGGRPGEFFGLRQLVDPEWTEEHEPGTAPGLGERPILRTTGAYGLVRHPGYAMVLLAMLATPLMTLDRATVLVATLIYLTVGIPLEERKLVALFGPDYEAYRARVPALVPRPWRP